MTEETEGYEKCQKCSGTFFASDFAEHDCEAVQKENEARSKRLAFFGMLGGMI